MGTRNFDDDYDNDNDNDNPGFTPMNGSRRGDFPRIAMAGVTAPADENLSAIPTEASGRHSGNNRNPVR
ncbi:hypothetical protein [Desulfatirhabdium butyrativorans]|uniref:hypothetical protein n=1 Tax=Desulfatirhabdium butyrativorans TaxID=340467 RepID=UPI00040AAEDB|nr:hypothetical protein [Desulfatirhabdium butyrativorans]